MVSTQYAGGKYANLKCTMLVLFTLTLLLANVLGIIII